VSKHPTFDRDGYPTDETLKTIEEWPYTDDFRFLMEYVRAAWSDYGWFEQRAPEVAAAMKDEDEANDGHWWCYATGGWSGNEDIIAALERNAVFHFWAWYCSVRGGYGEYHVRTDGSA
jgi:hypothetical protein